jgi:hypothetical protein
VSGKRVDAGRTRSKLAPARPCRVLLDGAERPARQFRRREPTKTVRNSVYDWFASFFVGVLVETTPPRVSAAFRRLWLGRVVSFVGSMMTVAALPYQVFDQTGSSLDVGLLGLAQLAPLVVFAVVGGVFAERAGEAPLAPGIDRASRCSVRRRLG